jgi:anti-anti-sigma regulatory factor
MLKITTLKENKREVLLRLDGKITAQWAVLLDRVCHTYLRQKKAVQLDCAHVDFIDAQGIGVLKKLPRERVVLRGAPSFITQLLSTGGRS